MHRTVTLDTRPYECSGDTSFINTLLMIITPEPLRMLVVVGLISTHHPLSIYLSMKSYKVTYGRSHLMVSVSCL